MVRVTVVVFLLLIACVIPDPQPLEALDLLIY